MGVDRYRVSELYAAGPDGEASGSGYRLGDQLVLTARHLIAPVLAGAGGWVLVRPVGVTRWLPARVAWQDTDADCALIAVEDEGLAAPGGESVLRWGELAGSDPVPCAAVVPVACAPGPDAGHRASVRAAGPAGAAAAGPAGPGRGLRLAVGPAGWLAVGGDVRRRGDRGQPSCRGDHRRSGRYQDRFVAVPVSRLLADEVSGPGWPAMGCGLRRRRSGRAGTCRCPGNRRSAWPRPTGR